MFQDLFENSISETGFRSRLFTKYVKCILDFASSADRNIIMKFQKEYISINSTRNLQHETKNKSL